MTENKRLEPPNFVPISILIQVLCKTTALTKAARQTGNFIYAENIKESLKICLEEFFVF